MYTKVYSENQKKDHLEDPGIDGRILKQILKKQSVDRIHLLFCTRQ
jgi:hypothetical protein